MLAEWIAECAADAPTVVVPWSSPDEGLAFVNLREHPYDLGEISETEAFPALGRALRALNAVRSPFMTAKCDVWPLSAPDDADQLTALQQEMNLESEEVTVGLGLYIDLVWRERSVFASAHQQSDRLERIVRRAEKLLLPACALQFVLRPAVLDFGMILEGFASTMYLTSLGPDTDSAKTRLEEAMDEMLQLLRSRDLEVPKASFTIES